MNTLADFFEFTPVVSIIIGIALVAVSVVLCLLNIRKTSKPLAVISSIVALVLAVVSSFIAYHFMIVIGHVAALFASACCLAKLNLVVNSEKDFTVSFASLTVKLFFPLAILFLLFGPWYVDAEFYGEGETGFYSVMAMFGLKGVGVSAFSFDNWHLITVISLALFAVVVGIQIYTVIQLFRNPDYADGWSLFHLVLTVVGTLFIYGVYSSDNFAILEVMPSVSETLKGTYLMYMILILAVLNKIVYFKRVDALLCNGIKKKK